MGEKETSELLPQTRQVPLPIDQTGAVRLAGSPGDDASPAERASNLNLSKSNIDRLAQSEADRVSTNLSIERQTPKRDFGD